MNINGLIKSQNMIHVYPAPLDIGTSDHHKVTVNHINDNTFFAFLTALKSSYILVQYQLLPIHSLAMYWSTMHLRICEIASTLKRLVLIITSYTERSERSIP